MIERSLESLAVDMKIISEGEKTLILWQARAYVWVSVNWQRTASDVERLTNESPMVGEIPRDSETAQMISLSSYPVEVAAVLGLEHLEYGLEVAAQPLESSPVVVRVVLAVREVGRSSILDQTSGIRSFTVCDVLFLKSG